MLTLIRRKPEAAPRVAVADVAAELGMAAVDPRRHGFPVDSADTLSLADATALIDRVTAARDEQNAAWKLYLEACDAWTEGRTEALRVAAAAKAIECRRKDKAPGPSHALVREAGREAAAQYERTVPRPSWDGEQGFGGHCRLLHAAAGQAAAATAGGVS